MSDPAPTTVPVTTWHLEMLDPSRLRPAGPPRIKGGAVEQVTRPTAALARAFYERVGRDWTWVEKLPWTDDHWRAWVTRPGYEMWIARVGTEPAGYLELDGDPHADVEIASFGLLPGHLGVGLGGALLTAATRRAWERGASRVWVHTCSLDGPHARANYEARGFELFDTVEGHLELPTDPDALRVTGAPRLEPPRAG